jgi:hypothetical protein
MYPHRIRLRGPWEQEALPARAEAPRRIDLPCNWNELPLGGASRVRFRRRFGYPGRIDAHERVWLVLAGAAQRLEVAVNGMPLGEQEGLPCEIDVTALLQARNELVLDVDVPAERRGPWGEVSLEIRCTAFLRKVRVWMESMGGSAELHVAGEVAGSAEGKLELYVVCDRAVAAYAVVVPGEAFHLREPAPAAGQAVRARVDLVNGASVWYTVEQELAVR